MATVLATNDIVRVTWDIAGLNVQTALPSVHYQIGTVVGNPTDQDMATKLDLVITPNLLPCLNALATYRAVIVQKIFPFPVTMRVIGNASSAVGTAGGNPVPQQVSGVLAWITATAGRRGRGRFYMPFPDRSQVSALTAHPTGPYIVNLAAFGIGVNGFVNFGTVPNTATCAQIIYGRAAHTAIPVTALQGRGLWGTQKRRGDYGRINVSPF